MDHLELESALWASVAACVKALEHTARAVDYRTLCEGLARLNHIVRSLLHRAACSAGQTRHQPERQVSATGKGKEKARDVGCLGSVCAWGGVWYYFRLPRLCVLFCLTHLITRRPPQTPRFAAENDVRLFVVLTS